MLYPGYRLLGSVENPTTTTGVVTSATDHMGQVRAWLDRMEGAVKFDLQAKFTYGSGGGTCKAFVQTTLDQGSTWFDIACFAFAQANATKVFSLSGLTPKTALPTLTDGALADDTVIDGILGDRLRCKVSASAAYAGSLLTVGVVPR